MSEGRTVFFSHEGTECAVPWSVSGGVVVEHRPAKLYLHPTYSYHQVTLCKSQYVMEDVAGLLEGCGGIVVGEGAAPFVFSNLALLPTVPVFVATSCAGFAARLAEDRRVRMAPQDDGWLIPAPVKAKGKLNVVVVAPLNAAGQGSAITKALEDHTAHAVRFIQYEHNFIRYAGTDLLLFEPPGILDKEAAEEALAVVEDADFFHFVQLPPQDDFDWKGRAHRNNAVVEYIGTDLVANADEVRAWHKETGVTGISGWDWMMLTAPDLPFMPYHFPALYDVEGEAADLPVWEKGTPLRICHPTTNRAFKSTQTFIDVIAALQAKGVEVEGIVIKGKTHEECMALKRSCHATFDQFHGIYGVSAVESMALGHAVVGGVSYWARSFYPDSPIIPATPGNLANVITMLVRGGSEGLAGHRMKTLAYVRRTHALNVGAQRLSSLYDHLRHGHRLLTA